ncbi:cysteine desulfurase family protein [Alkalibacterium olivapovliticus]|uniref:cysteine desulfurase n=1 Tax=Alkalibacterium olivapovliticus TaxID=99907 RepID=A0A2T0WB23_9LACT|nr:cysteine desulfurase family protein [Alkalibacterium olivapovliticus]PRY83909.1 cysteine desulfurase [Alkalibacterium olivapovliticus]
MENYIYLDHAATTPMHPEVIDVMTEAMTSSYGNASSTHRIGRVSKGILEEARAVLAASINAASNEIVMTSGGTESDNMAIINTAVKYSSVGKHIITTNVEHAAVKEPLKQLERNGFEVTVLPVNKEGSITIQQVKEAIREDTILVTVIYGNNEIGTLMPITEIGEYLLTLDHKVVFHTDAVQAYGTEDIHVKDQHIDMLSVSSHKINGPKGLGFLYVSDELSIPGLILGGQQENKRRAGTENIPGIAGFKRAVEIRQANKPQLKKDYQKLKNRCIVLLEESDLKFEVNGSVENSLPHILSVHIKGVEADKLLIHLDLAGVAVSIGSACSAGNVEPSHVLQAIHSKAHPAIEETIRFSFGYGVTEADIEAAVQKLAKAVKFLA